MKAQPLSQAFRHAWNGMVHFFLRDRNGKIHLLAAVLVSIAGLYLSIAPVEWCVLALCIGLVIGMEMLNFGLEKLCDVVHSEWHPVVKVIKDVAAGAVFFSAIISVIIALVIFIPKVMMLV